VRQAAARLRCSQVFPGGGGPCAAEALVATSPCPKVPAGGRWPEGWIA
jgi:hypothetical protein